MEGGRPLGIPTVAGRIAQMVVKQRIEPELEKHFHPSSMDTVRTDPPWRRSNGRVSGAGNGPGSWVLDMDIKGLFNDIDHDLLMRAVRKHVKNKWEILYIERWLKAPYSIHG